MANRIGELEFEETPHTRGEWEALAENLNARSIAAAQEEFTRNGGQDLADDCEYLLHELKIRRRLLDSGDEPLAFGAFDRDMIARVLACEAEVSYTDYSFMGEDGDEDEVIDISDDIPIGLAETTCPAKEAKIRGEFIEAYTKYLYDSAAFAKSLGAESAMRLYLKAWKLVHGPGIDGSTGSEKRFSGANAIKAVNLEAVAADKLWLAVAAKKLPAFKVKEA